MIAERLRRRMHRALRESQAPYLNALLRGFGRGLGMVGIEAAVRAMYLDTARKGWLDLWASGFVMTRNGEDDKTFLARIVSRAFTRMNTTKPAIQAAILDATGIVASLENSGLRVARYDQLERMADGHFMADFEPLIFQDPGGRWGDPHGQFAWPANDTLTPKYDNTPPTHPGYKGLTPVRPGWGPNGMLIILAEQYTQARERDVLWAIRDNIPAFLGFDVLWGHKFQVELSDELIVTDTPQPPDSGWGVDPWSESTWG